MRYEKWDIRYLSSLTLETPAAPGLSWNTEERILTTGRSPSGVTCNNNICIIKHCYSIQYWYEILILSVSDIQYCLNYTKGIRHKKRETTKIMERCHFETDKTDREYQLSVARADIYIHSIHFLPVRWGEMRTPYRKRTSPAHSTRCFQ